MLSLPLLLAGVFAEAVLGNPLSPRADYRIFETHYPPVSWKELDVAPAKHRITLNIGLKQTKIHELEQHLNEISDPDNERYGQHLTDAEVHEYTKPSSESVDLVHSWLFDNGIEPHRLSYSPAGDFITVTLPVSAVEELLDTVYSVWEHDDGTQLVRTPSWSLPEHLFGHIDSIQPTNSWLRTRPHATQWRMVGKLSPAAVIPAERETPEGTIPGACNFDAITPHCLRTLYGTNGYVVKSGKSLVGLNDFLNETNNRSDTALFLRNFRSNAVGEAYAFTFRVINGGSTNQNQETPAQLAAGTELEGNLDVQTLIGLDFPMPLVAYTTGGSPPYIPDENTPTDTNEPYMTWLNAILAEPASELPQTLSTSYGDDEQTVPKSYATKVCSQLMTLTSKGVSLFFGSGDSGVGANGTCVSNDGKNTPMFIPTFPSACQYVTSVGGTKNYPAVAAYDPRNGYASGGGFSNYFPRPAFQNTAVEKYLSNLGSTYKGLYNPEGRAYPDLSAQSVSFITAWNGTFVLLDGTSAATPTVAGVFALVNDALMANGKPPLGWINPLLYSKLHKTFTDVTEGSSIGCNGAGFEARSGWDPVTGWGTPNFKSLRIAVGA